ncbi:TPA: hypothetical protein HA361_06025 [Candidatus Woesearchaeota archaeon]|nr:hypothetical protein [Candidatus Woesearchaeota archaeon]
MKKPYTELDYIGLYAKRLHEDSGAYFRQHKRFLDSQYQSSREFFHQMFGEGEEFKKNARKYLKDRGIT